MKKTALNILVVKLNALGDLVIATPAIRHLKENLPGSHLHLLTTEWTAPAAMNNPCIDDMTIVPDDIFFKPGWSTVIPTFELLHKMRTMKFTCSVSFHANRMVDRFIRLANVKTRFRFGDSSDNRTVHLDENRHSSVTAWELADLAVRNLGGSDGDFPLFEEIHYDWFITDQEESQVQDILNNHRLDDNSYVVIMPGGGVSPGDNAVLRRWASEKFAELADLIQDEFGLEVVLSGGKSDIDASQQVVGSIKGKIIDLTGKFDIRVTAALQRRSTLVISNDSGPMHIASAVGTPVVGIFGPTGPNTKLPPSNAYAARTGIPCSPCYFGRFKACIFDRFICMEDLSVEAVFEVVKLSLKNSVNKVRV